MVTLMNILAKQTARMAMLLSIFVGLLATEGLAAKKGEPAVTHISFADSAKNHLVNIRAQISDSVLVTNLANAPTHYDNAMFVRLFLDGHFTQAFHFDARVMVSNDYTNRYINDNFYHPSEGLPYNKQSETRRTWDQFSAKIDYQLKPVTLLAGFDYLEFGPARYNHVILRGNRSIDRPWQDTTSRIWRPAPTPYFGYRFEIGPIEYSQYAAKLFEKKNKGKYMHAHRLDLHLPFNITLGLSETALYGSTTEPAHTNPNADADSTDRDFEWNYVLPFIMYNFQEHIQGDQDNISLAFDLSVRTLPHWEFVGQQVGCNGRYRARQPLRWAGKARHVHGIHAHRTLGLHAPQGRRIHLRKLLAESRKRPGTQQPRIPRRTERYIQIHQCNALCRKRRERYGIRRKHHRHPRPRRRHQ